MVYYSASRAIKPINNKDKDKTMKKKIKVPTVKPMIRKGWVIRVVDRMGMVHFPMFNGCNVDVVDVERQDDYYNDVIPHLRIFGTKDIAKSYVDGVRKAALAKAATTYLTRPILPIKVDVVRYFRKIG